MARRSITRSQTMRSQIRMLHRSTQGFSLTAFLVALARSRLKSLQKIIASA
jgi:hypothetical protein